MTLVCRPVHPDGARRGRLPSALSPEATGGLCRVCAATAANWRAVPQAALAAPSRRGANIAFARQCGAYLAHTVFRVGFTDIGAVFRRDRTTIRHACARVEDRRDDIGIDRALGFVEAALQQWAGIFCDLTGEGAR